MTISLVTSSLRAGLRALSSRLVEPQALSGRFRLGLPNLRAESSPSQALSSPSRASSFELCVHPYLGLDPFSQGHSKKTSFSSFQLWLWLWRRKGPRPPPSKGDPYQSKKKPRSFHSNHNHLNLRARHFFSMFRTQGPQGTWDDIMFPNSITLHFPPVTLSVTDQRKSLSIFFILYVTFGRILRGVKR
jgi:hypothetical protein